MEGRSAAAQYRAWYFVLSIALSLSCIDRLVAQRYYETLGTKKQHFHYHRLVAKLVISILSCIHPITMIVYILLKNYNHHEEDEEHMNSSITVVINATQLVSILLYIVLLYKNKQTSHWTIRLFLLLTAGISFLKCIDVINTKDLDLQYASNLVNLISRFFLGCIVALFNDREPPLPSSQELSPLEKSGLWELILSSWISPLTVLSKHRRLEFTDIPVLSQADSTTAAATKFINALDNNSSSLTSLVFRIYGMEIALFALWSAFNKAVGLASPILLSLFLTWASSSTSENHHTGYVLAGCLTMQSIVTAISSSQYTLHWKRFDLRIRAGVSAAIYKKSLSGSSEPNVINLLTVDLPKLISLPGSVFDIVLIPIEVAVALYLLHQQVSYAFTVGIIVLVGMMPLQTFLGKSVSAYTKAMLHYRDERIKVLSEGFKHMKVLKFIGRIPVFTERVEVVRNSEVSQLARRKYVDAFCVVCWASLPVVIQTSVFVTLILYLHQDLSAANAFTSIALLNRLIYPINYFPWIINGMLEAKVSANRIQEYLHKDDDVLRPSSTSTSNDAILLQMKDCVFSYIKEEEDDDLKEKPLLLKDSFTLDIPSYVMSRKSSPRITIVTGSVGSGKSSFLKALLGELVSRNNSSIFESKLRRVSYAPQVPWVSSRLDIVQNIVFHNPFCQNRFENIVQAAGLLERDLNLRKTTTLSGGQALRVNLARALYQKSELYVLDDPTASLDFVTSTKIFTSLFGPRGLFTTLQDDAPHVVMATNASMELLQILPTSSNVEVLFLKDGKIIERGSLLELLRLNGAFNQAYGGGSNTLKSITSSSDNTPLLTSKIPSEGKEELRLVGSISPSIWKSYGQAMGIRVVTILLFSLVLMQLSRNALDGWIAYFTQQKRMSPRTFATGLCVITSINVTAVVFRSFVFARAGLNASNTLYTKLNGTLLSAPLSFFQETPIGRIINRISGDTYNVDESLPFTLNILLKNIFDLVGGIILVTIGNIYVMSIILPVTILFSIIQASYRPLSRHLKRLESTSVSPLMDIVSDTLNGVHVIKLLDDSRRNAGYYQQFLKALKTSQEVILLSASASTWFGIRLDLLGVCLTAFVAFYAAAFNTSNNAAGVLGLVLTYALPIVGQLNSTLNSVVDTEKLMISVERVLEYCDNVLPEEEQDSTEVLRTWPSHGMIQFHQLSVTFKSTAAALRNISCRIEGGEKIGICGRTGAGKSTLLSCIFRIVPFTTGAIVIDGIDITSIRLDTLRSRLTCVPQDPVLFSGTLRYNLDPNYKYSDGEISSALKRVGMLASVQESVFSFDDELCKEFSLGQRQLLCLARAILQKSSVVCLDEATASVDVETERILNKTVAVEFKNCTVLTVAHRIHSVIKSCDRIMVLRDGEIAEFDLPTNLMANPSSLLNELRGGNQIL